MLVSVCIKFEHRNQADSKEVVIMRVVIFGATGLAGSGVLEACLEHPEITSITSVSRRSTKVQHTKLKEIIHQDFLDYSAIKSELAGHDACFWCLGVSSAKVRDEQTYHLITHDYTLAAAETLAELNPKLIFCFLTGMGTDPGQQSRFRWARVKGQAETALAAVPLGEAYMLRPGGIFRVGNTRVSTLIAKMLGLIYRVLNILLPSLVISNREFGQAVIKVALTRPEQHVFENRDLRKIAK